MKGMMLLAIVVVLLVSPIILLAAPSGTFSNSNSIDATNADPSVIQISWGQMQAEMAEQEVTVTKYEGGEAHMAVSYEPYFFQYFPVWAEVSVVQAPPWLTISPAQVQFPLRQGETETDDIVLALNDDVNEGTIGLVEMEVEGRTTILPSLLAINEGRATFIVEVA